MTSIGWLPCDWDVVAIKDVTNIVTGATPSTAVKEYWGGEIPWMSSGELNQLLCLHSRVSLEDSLGTAASIYAPRRLQLARAAPGSMGRPAPL